MQWFKQANANGWTAIRSSQQQTCLAHVVRRESMKPLVKYADIVANDIYQANQAKHLVNQYKLKKSSCTLVLDADSYQLLQLEKPNVPAEEQKQAIRWKLKDMVDYPIDQATIDFLDIPPDPAYPNRQAIGYAVTAKNSLIAQVSNQLLMSSINLKAIDIQALAQRNIAACLEIPNRGLAMLTILGKAGLLTITAGGELYHARLIEIDEALTAGVIERVALELQRTLDHFDRQFPFVTVSQLLVAPFEGRDEVMAHFKNALYIKVEPFELSDVFDFSDHVPQLTADTQATLLPVLGAALREEVAA